MSNAPRLFLKLEAFAEPSFPGGRTAIQCGPDDRLRAVKVLRDAADRIEMDIGLFPIDMSEVSVAVAADPDEDDEPLPMPPDIEKPIPVSQDWRDKRGLR